MNQINNTGIFFTFIIPHRYRSHTQELNSFLYWLFMFNLHPFKFCSPTLGKTFTQILFCIRWIQEPPAFLNNKICILHIFLHFFCIPVFARLFKFLHFLKTFVFCLLNIAMKCNRSSPGKTCHCHPANYRLRPSTRTLVIRIV